MLYQSQVTLHKLCILNQNLSNIFVRSFDFFIFFRERLKLFNEALSVFNKFFPSVPSKKRSRLEGYNNERSNFILSGERSARGQASKSHAIPGGAFEHEMQKSEERIKNALSNKRTRTSLVDARGVCTLDLLHIYVLLCHFIQYFDHFSFCICILFVVHYNGFFVVVLIFLLFYV